jgi:hypothetical protein
MGLTDEERIESFLVNSGLAPQSIEAVRARFPRWARRLRAEGVEEIPASPWQPGADGDAMNLLNMFVKQVALVKDPGTAHELRNLTRVRPWKP